MKKRSTILILVITLLSSCGYNPKGYSDIDKLYSDFVTSLQNSDKEKLKEFCEKATIDKATIDYMEDNNFSYRNIPEIYNKEGITVENKTGDYYQKLQNYQTKMIDQDLLNDLTYIGREDNRIEVLNKELGIITTHSYFLLKSNTDTLYFTLGEMYKVNGVWKSFTWPRAYLNVPFTEDEW